MSRFLVLPVLLILSACVSEPVAQIEDVARRYVPPNPQLGVCYGRGIETAITETVTEQILDTPAQLDDSGQVIVPARYVTVTATRTLEDAEEIWFESPCEVRRGDPDFVAQVQRALQVRSYYDGAINGFYDVPTRAAVQTFQVQTSGILSGVLSVDSAQRLGLVAIGRPE